MNQASSLKWAAALAAMIALAILVGNPDSAYAQDGNPATQIAVDHVELLPNQGANIMALGTSRILHHGEPAIGAVIGYSKDPVRIMRETTVDRDDVLSRPVEGRVRADLHAALGAFDALELSASLPFVLHQFGDDLGPLGLPDQDIDGTALGDLRLMIKARMADGRAGGFGAAAAVSVHAPTGDTESFNSDGVARFEPQLILDFTSRGGTVAAANLGYQLRGDTVVGNYTTGDQFRYAFGFETPVGAGGARALRLAGSFHGAVTVGEADTSADAALGFGDEDRSTNAELLFGAKVPIGDHLVANAGFGLGLERGVGDAEMRAFAGLSWSNGPMDRDDDGLTDDIDACPDRPEDLDGFEDTDGCPDLDDDNDKILDRDDGCRLEPEDVDSFEDADGCPDLDNDKDGIADLDDRCPMQPEDMDGVEDTDGCPEDAAGRPAARPPVAVTGGPRVVVTDARIFFFQPIHFAYNRDHIDPISHSVLQAIAQALRTHPEITLVRIEGHSDPDGDAGYNLWLSDRRARAVAGWLVHYGGVAANRVYAQGFGESRLLTRAVTRAENWANRRVELHIAGRAPAGQPAPAVLPAPAAAPAATPTIAPSAPAPQQHVPPAPPGAWGYPYVAPPAQMNGAGWQLQTQQAPSQYPATQYPTSGHYAPKLDHQRYVHEQDTPPPVHYAPQYPHSQPYAPQYPQSQPYTPQYHAPQQHHYVPQPYVPAVQSWYPAPSQQVPAQYYTPQQAYPAPSYNHGYPAQTQPSYWPYAAPATPIR